MNLERSIGREGSGEVPKSMENMGLWRKVDQRLNTLQDIGVAIPQNIVNVYHTYSQPIYANEDLIFVLLQEERTRGVKRASRNSIILESRISTLQTFPVNED